MIIPTVPFLLLILGVILALLGIPFLTDLTWWGVVLTLVATVLIILTAKPERHHS
jgi:uncharacterized membrane protein YoaK (UPF0700 family)